MSEATIIISVFSLTMSVSVMLSLRSARAEMREKYSDMSREVWRRCSTSESRIEFLSDRLTRIGKIFAAIHKDETK